MMDYFDPRLWVAVIGATIMKLLTSEYESVLRAIVMVFSALFSVWLATEPVLDYLALDPKRYGYLIAALLALTGENLMRWVLKISQNPVKAWLNMRSGGGRS